MAIFDETAEADAADRERGRNDTDTTHVNEDAAKLIKALVDRIEIKETKKKAVADEITSIYAEAKGRGLDTKVLRQLIKRRKQDAAERAEQDALLELYEGIFG